MRQAKTTRDRRGFTLTEILIVISIIGLLVAVSFSAFNSAVAQSRVSRTKVIIAKLDQLVMERYEGYRTRPVPIRMNVGSESPRQFATRRLEALREIMRMELPCSRSDVQAAPAVVSARTAINNGYNRRVPPGWTDDWEAAECLYLIIASMRDREKSALDFFSPDEIGDTDGDGVNEILDSWGQPIQFIRWAPGYRSDSNPPALTMQNSGTPDSFDLLKSDSRWSDSDMTNDPIDLKPLIYSFGPDKIRTGLQLSSGTPLNDPYRQVSGNYIGTILAASEVGDNISNHYQEAE